MDRSCCRGVARDERNAMTEYSKEVTKTYWDMMGVTEFDHDSEGELCRIKYQLTQNFATTTQPMITHARA